MPKGQVWACVSLWNSWESKTQREFVSTSKLFSRTATKYSGLLNGTSMQVIISEPRTFSRTWKIEYFQSYQWIKDVAIISNCSPPIWAREPWGNSGRKRMPCSSYQPAAAPYIEQSPRKLRMWKYSTLAPDSCNASKEDVSGPRLLHLPMCRKMLNSLTWGIWFSVISNTEFWHSDNVSFVATFCITWVPLSGPPELFHQGYMRCCPLGLKS